MITMGGKRYEACIGCGKLWNVSVSAPVLAVGYVCPHCRERNNRTGWLTALICRKAAKV